VARLNADVIAVDENRWRHLRECHMGHCCFPWNGGRQLRTLTVTMRPPWFDLSLSHTCMPPPPNTHTHTHMHMKWLLQQNPHLIMFVGVGIAQSV
jgi:hypothetical protein